MQGESIPDVFQYLFSLALALLGRYVLVYMAAPCVHEVATGSVGRMGPEMFDLLYELMLFLCCDQPF